jgi:uncharacterized protein (TIGR02284 family)
MNNMSNENKAVPALNELLERTYDAEKGFKQAADDIDSQPLKEFLLKYAKQRQEFSNELKNEIHKLGGEPTDSSSFSATLHRTWIDFKSALSQQNPKAVLEECERGEKHALKDYEDVLNNHELPLSTKEIIEKQHAKIQNALQKIEALENTVFNN